MSLLIHGLRAPEPPPTRLPSSRRFWGMCWRGELPAEALAVVDPKLADQLIFDLWRLGWTDTELADHTKHTTYTIARIRTRLGLAPNRTIQGTTAA